jgi:hypothetical protein
MRRNEHPSSRPSAMTGCLACSLKTLLIPSKAALPFVGITVWSSVQLMAGFEVATNGRFWAATEVLARGAGGIAEDLPVKPGSFPAGRILVIIGGW